MTPTSARPQGLLPRTDTDAWWRDAVIYQIYPRSFADANGDGIGDIQGIREHVDHLVALGVDAVWLSPFYPSPQVDAGYDVSDYFDLAPEYGSLQDLDALIADLHEAGIRVIVDLVPNHSSDQHEWFRAALEAGPGSPERDRYIFRHSDDGAPNNWGSLFGGPAWQPVEPLTGRSQDRGWYYLHLFAAEQPDFNWSNADVHEHFRTFLRFWVERGVEGFRVDVAHGLVKAEGLPDDDLGPDRWNIAASPDEDTAHEKLPDVGPAFNQPGVHDIYREWRRVLDEVGQDILLVAEAWVPTEADAAQYVRADEMSQAFNFPFLGAGWDADELRRVIDVSLSEYGAVGAPATWVLSNHDVVRHASRLAYPADMDTDPGIGPKDPQPDAELGLARARAATLFMLGLPGSAYLYQGEELGLPEHTTMEDEARQDPLWERTNHLVPGRDGCRVPLPWTREGASYGYNASGRTWLPQPEGGGEYSPQAQEGCEDSTLTLYRRSIALRRELGLGRGSVEWLDSEPGVLLLHNGTTAIVLNTTEQPVTIEGVGRTLITSWRRSETDESDAANTVEAAGAVVVPPNGACWLDDSAGGTDGGDPR